MLKFVCAFMLYYYICSICCTIGLWKKFHKEENKQILDEDLKQLAGDIAKNDNIFNKRVLTKEDALVIYYLVCIFFSFAIVPVVLFNKIVGKKNA